MTDFHRRDAEDTVEIQYVMITIRLSVNLFPSYAHSIRDNHSAAPGRMPYGLHSDFPWIFFAFLRVPIALSTVETVRLNFRIMPEGAMNRALTRSELRALRTTMLNSCLRLRKFLGSQSRKFFCAGLSRGQYGGNHVSSFFRHDIAMSLVHFGDQAVRSQQSEPPSHRGHLPALLSSVLGGVVQTSTHIAIAKPVKRKLAPVDGRQELSVGFPQRIERTVAPSIALHHGRHTVAACSASAVQTCTAASAVR